ncbi:GDSL-type esterase/lipase family protein [Gorillibacterium timonense]|uniref:GDSL-type esterase/lipase family protein n=1 Tax=Gorillibacterium timonense TaxID=1689269 RepID=UPI00071E5043|nr:GDSL-type esterase/lipase family protein [Gorillibacterium timonense]
MLSTKALWRIAGTAALAATLLLIAGFGYAVRTVVFPGQASSPSTAPVPSETPVSSAASGDLDAASHINILAVGDSLTRGLGDTSGKGGYVDRVKDGLKTELGKDVYVWNLAVSGAKTADLLEQLQGKSDAIPDAAKKANVILLTIGGNDLFQMGITDPEAAANAGKLTVDYDSVQKNLPDALKRLEAGLTRLSELNPNAKIVYVMFYHPFLDYDKERIGALLVQQWYAKAFETANRLGNVTVVPTFDLFDQTPQKYLYTDHFHPNAEGYERIAERVLQTLY